MTYGWIGVGICVCVCVCDRVKEWSGLLLRMFSGSEGTNGAICTCTCTRLCNRAVRLTGVDATLLLLLVLAGSRCVGLVLAA